MIKKFSIVVLLFFTASPAFSEVPEWLLDAIKVKSPNQLAYFIEMNDSCPFEKEELNKITEGVLIRSRIKPLKEDIFVKGRIYLSLSLSCIRLDNGSQVFTIGAEFARWLPHPPIVFDSGFGYTGIGPKSFISQNFKGSTERAITAFIKSNFNL